MSWSIWVAITKYLIWVFYGDLYSTKFIARSSGGQKSKTWCQPPELLDKDPLSGSYHYLWGLEFHHMNFGGTHIFRPWHWCTWRDWGKSWKCVSSWTSGLALITQKQMLALGSLEDPRGYECSCPGPCWTSWAKLSVDPLFLCFAWFRLCYLHFTDKENNEGKGLVAEYKDYHSHFLKFSGCGILKSNLIIKYCKCLTVNFFIQCWNEYQLWDTLCHTCNLKNFEFTIFIIVASHWINNNSCLKLKMFLECCLNKGDKIHVFILWCISLKSALYKMFFLLL